MQQSDQGNTGSADPESAADGAEGGNEAGLIDESVSETLREDVLDAVVFNWLPDWMQQALEYLAAYPVLLIPLLALVGYVLGKIFQLVLSLLASRITSRTRTDFDDRLVALLKRPILTTPIILALLLATTLLGMAELPNRITVGVLATILMISWVRFALKATHVLLEVVANSQGKHELIQARTMPMFEIGMRVLLVAIGGYLFLAIWGIDPTAWLASAGVIGIAVGFAARDTLANLFSGLFIVADAPYKIGDFVVLDPTGERGRVTHLGMRSTRLLTLDDVEITIPNAVIANSKIINQSGGPSPKYRIRIPVGVAYGSDVDRTCEVLKAVADDSDWISREPEPRVRMRAFGDSSLDFELLCWVKQPNQRGRVTHELLMEIYRRFEAEGLEIPFPQRDLHVRSMPEGGG
ncbi:MAG: mechanosensitive ion channel family protein [Xanthomonadales bacterium]|nr:mechanosensitive ion channel family protein [Xanthomonadales bacterium]